MTIFEETRVIGEFYSLHYDYLMCTLPAAY